MKKDDIEIIDGRVIEINRQLRDINGNEVKTNLDLFKRMSSVSFDHDSGKFIEKGEYMKEKKLKIKPLHENFKQPIKGSEYSACYDCYAVSRDFSMDGKLVTYGLGFAVEPPIGYSIELMPRSSIRKTGLSLCNSIGQIDWDYRGQVMATFYTRDADIENIYQVGDRVCQMKLVKDEPTQLVIVDSIDETERGDGGFGSTGLK